MRQVREEARSKFGDERKVSLILSLGSGRPAVLSLDLRASVQDSLHNLLLHVVLDCEKAARELPDQLLQFEGYLRLNVTQGMENLKISDWDKLGSISEHTDVYLHKPDIGTRIDNRSRLLQERGGSTCLGQLCTFPHDEWRAFSYLLPRSWHCDCHRSQVGPHLFSFQSRSLTWFEVIIFSTIVLTLCCLQRASSKWGTLYEM
jgi:hypothetical protein